MEFGMDVWAGLLRRISSESFATKNAWLASLVCLIVSLKFATVFCRRSPLLFTALALLACNWAILVSLYAADPTIDAMPAVSGIGGFLLVYLGGLLSLSAGEDKAGNIVGWHVTSTWLLAITALPTLPAVYHVLLEWISIEAGHKKIPLVITIVLDCVGLGSIAWGAFNLFPRRAAILLTVIALGYGISEVLFTYLTWSLNVKIPSSWKYLFAFWKLALTFSLGYSIAYIEMSDEDRKKGIIHWTLVLMSLRNWTSRRSRSVSLEKPATAAT